MYIVEKYLLDSIISYSHQILNTIAQLRMQKGTLLREKKNSFLKEPISFIIKKCYSFHP